MTEEATVETIDATPVESPADTSVETDVKNDGTAEAASGESGDILSSPEAESASAEAKPEGEGIAESGETPPEEIAEKAETADQPISYDQVELPDGLEVTNQDRFNKQISAFDTKFADLEKKFGIDHEEAAAFRKEAMGLALTELQRIAQQAQETAAGAIEAAKAEAEQQRIDRVASWKQQFEESELSGNRRQTTLNRAESTIREFSGNEKEFRQALQETGMANHPAMIRLLANVGSVMQEGRLVAAQMPSPTPKSKAGKLYGT